MCRLVLVLLLFLSSFTTYAQQARGEPQANRSATAIAKVTSNNSAKEALLQKGHYRNSNGADVHGSAKSKNGQLPEGAVALCRDGTYSFGRSQRGIWSYHAGVAQWL